MTPWLAILIVVLLVEIWGYLDGVRVVTLSRLVWRAHERWPWLDLPVGAFFFWLWWHWFGY